MKEKLIKIKNENASRNLDNKQSDIHYSEYKRYNPNYYLYKSERKKWLESSKLNNLLLYSAYYLYNICVYREQVCTFRYFEITWLINKRNFQRMRECTYDCPQLLTRIYLNPWLTRYVSVKCIFNKQACRLKITISFTCQNIRNSMMNWQLQQTCVTDSSSMH